MPLLMFFFAFPIQRAESQTCEFSFATCPIPASLAVCDLRFTVPLEVVHTYSTDHDFTVVITFRPSRIDLINPGVLSGVSSTTLGNGDRVVTGTFTVPFTPDVSMATIGLIFDRISSWDGVDNTLFIEVYDEDCDTDPVATFNGVINIFPQFNDLRNAPSNLVSELQLFGWLQTCTSSFVDNILIGTELIVDEGTDMCFFGGGGGGPNSVIALLPGAKIIVENGASLALDRVSVFTCGTELAQGIVVEPGGILSIDTSILSDSRFAVDAKPGSIIAISRTSFLDNFIGVRFDMGSAAEGNKRVDLLRFERNAFATVSAAIKAPFTGMPETVESRGYCGIWLNDYRDFNVFGEANTFDSLANGIIARRSTLNLNSMRFNDMNSADDPSTYPQEGFGIHLDGRGNRPYWAHINEMWHTMTFNNCKTGVFGTRYSAQVDNVDMTNVTTGIDWSRSQMGEVRLRSNDISARRFGIRSFLNEPLDVKSVVSANTITVTTAGGGLTPVTGIEMQEAGIMGANFLSGWRVTGNDVTMSAGGRGILYRNGALGIIDGNSVINDSMPSSYTGIFTEGSLLANVSRNTITQNSAIGLGAANGIFSAAGAANTYQCNCIDNTHIGAQFLDLADFTDAVRGNNFNTHTTGLQIGAAGVGQAFIGLQNRTGNLWDLGEIPTGEFGGINWGADQDIIIKSRFLVPGAMGSNAEHPPVDPSPGWFFQFDEGASLACSTACSFPSSGGVPPRLAETGVPSLLDYAIVNGTLSDNEDMAWKGDYRLYRKLLRQPAMEQYDTVFSAFKTAQATTAAGKLAYIAEERAKLFLPDSLDQIADADFRDDIAVQTESLRVLDSLKQAGASLDTAAYNALVAQKAADETDYAAFLQELDSLRQLQIAALLTLNAGVGTSTTCVTNHRLVNEILLDLLATGDEAPSPTNLDILAAIAEMCPVEGGDAVYEARAIVERLTGETYDDVVLCAVEERPSGGRDSDSRTEQKAVVVFPNPSTGQIAWTGLEEQEIRVRVLNQLGQLMIERRTSGSSLDLSALPEGVYHLQFNSVDGKTLLNTSLLIQKR